tara:strand:- start:3908 stop:4150 length:243 start_codon:yes stop_codon:yes gene_type:complete
MSNEYETAFDSFTAAANELRFASGAARVELTCCHLAEAERDCKSAFFAAIHSGDFDRADEIGQALIEIQAAVERLRKLPA